jgi:hypothetical protein
MSFDPNQFLDMQFTDSNDTVLRPVPVGEYPAVAESAELRPWQAKDGSSSGLALDIKWSIDDAELQAELGRKPLVKQGIMLDMNEAGTGFDMGKGKNVGLGRLREALGMNEPGKPFSFTMIPGNAARVKVAHRPDKSNPEVIYAEVKEASALGG